MVGTGRANRQARRRTACNMKPRRSGNWQKKVDDRILELLKSESWSTPSVMELEPHIHATEKQIQARCLRLADAELVGLSITEGWKVEITTKGRLYLAGEVDVRLYERPRSEKELMEVVERLTS
jgi:hypothetical protein